MNNQEQLDSCYEVPYDGRKLHHCRACQHIGPMSDFTYMRSRLADQNAGFADNVRVLHEGKLCRKCRSKTQRRKPLGKLTERELHNRVATDELRPAIRDAIVARRHAKALRAQTEAVERRWWMERKAAWETPILADLREEIAAVAQADKNSKLRGAPALPERLAFFTNYKKILAACRARIRWRFIRQHSEERRKPREGEHWREQITDDERRALFELWEAIPEAVRVRLRMPAALNASDGFAPRRRMTKRQVV